ncbi:hypothetical protein A0256_13295 [Mucilaginibacter sp. PAMC 26640]|nr:hypothetical protein A0256_13295 [Mucilaginibacter sp. PAMC 26640]
MLPGLVKNYVNKKLDALPGYHGHVDDIDIALFRGAYVIKGLVLAKKTDTPKYPFLAISRTDLSIEWKALLRGKLVGEVEMQRPAIHIIAATEDIDKEPSRQSWTQTIDALMPMKVNRLIVTNGRFSYLDAKTDLHINNMNLTALNLRNVASAPAALPSTINLTGNTIGGGQLKADMKANVIKEIPDFNLNMRLNGADLTALNSFLKEHVKFDIYRGTIDLYGELKMTDGEFIGYVKPFIKNLKVLDIKKDIKKKGGILNVVKKAVVGLFAKAVENPKTHKIATKVPIKGNIKNLKTDGWKTFVGVLKNAFVKAFKQGIDSEVNN